jgi:DNA-binding HxlR family transcriptional regulator
MSKSNMSTPIPGQQVRGSKSGKPIMALLDLLGRTWALGVIWNLSQGPATFRELQLRCEQISPSLLNTRLKELKQLNIIEVADKGYTLSQYGEDLFSIISPLSHWSKDWAASIDASKAKV